MQPSDDSLPRRYLAVLGDAGDIRAWSGIPYHFYQAGLIANFFSGALDLRADRLRWRRLAWNLSQVLRGKHFGGFQYSRSCLNYVFGHVEERLAECEVVSHFQLFPPDDLARRKRLTFSFYIDMPLTRLFEEYGESARIGESIAREAIQRETDGYRHARFVTCMSSWAAQAVREEYGIPEEKVKVILPGANLDEAIVERLTADMDDKPVETDFTPQRPFRLGFIAKHPKRKGLPRLITAAERLRSWGYPVEVVVIGSLPSEYRKHAAVRWLGIIDKYQAMEQFVQAVKGFDLGCLPSYAEGLGISTLESLRLGIPVLGTAVGGISDCIPPKAGILVPRDASPEVIAGAIRPLLDDPAGYRTMRQEARGTRHYYTWDRAVKEFQKLWSS